MTASRTCTTCLLLAKDLQGYRNLMAIVSDASVTGFYYRPQVDEELLRHYAEGLIGTSACMSGIVSKSVENGELEEARKWAARYSGIFGEGDFYIELQEQGIITDNGVSQTQLNRELSSIAGELGLPMIGTNDIHYVMREDAKTQDMMLCIQTGKVLDDTQRMRFSCDQFYMRSPEEMSAALAPYPEAISTTRRRRGALRRRARVRQAHHAGVRGAGAARGDGRAGRRSTPTSRSSASSA